MLASAVLHALKARAKEVAPGVAPTIEGVLVRAYGGGQWAPGRLVWGGLWWRTPHQVCVCPGQVLLHCALRHHGPGLCLPCRLLLTVQRLLPVI